jgi:hypothetical protein
MVGNFDACARVESGQAAEPPSKVMKSRRLMFALEAQDGIS